MEVILYFILTAGPIAFLIIWMIKDYDKSNHKIVDTSTKEKQTNKE